MLCEGVPFLFMDEDLAAEGLESGTAVSQAELDAMVLRSVRRGLAWVESELRDLKTAN